VNKSVPILNPVELPSGSSSVISVGRCKDYAGSSFVARAILIGNNTWVECFERDRDGNLLQLPSFEMENGPSANEGMRPRKIADMTLMLDRADVVATVTGYNLTATTRLHYQEEFRWPNVAVPFPQGVSEMSGAGVEMFSEVEVGITPEQVEEIVTRVIRAEEARQTTEINNGMVARVKQAINELGVLTLNNIYTSYGLWRRFVETTYEQCKKVIDERFPR
jgi:hypothetical protein